MSPETFWFVLVLIVGNQIIIGLFCRYLAEQKNRDGFVWFWLGFLFGPMPAALLTLIGLPVAAARKPGQRTPLTIEDDGEMSPNSGELSLDQLIRLSDEEARTLAKHEGVLPLNGLTTLSVEAAKCLAQHDGELSLNGLTTLSVEAAKFLAQHDGWLSLNGLTTLSIDVAKSLAQHTGGLDLNGLTTLSEEAATALRANPRVNMPRKFRR